MALGGLRNLSIIKQCGNLMGRGDERVTQTHRRL